MDRSGTQVLFIIEFSNMLQDSESIVDTVRNPYFSACTVYFRNIMSIDCKC